MGKLRVFFNVGLAHPLTLDDLPKLPANVRFSDTGNTVTILPPTTGGSTDDYLGVFDKILLYVERECTDEEGNDTTYANNERLKINRDAGRAFWLLFEHLRELEARGNFVASYPVVPAEAIQENPLVRTCRADWIYNEVSLQPQSFGGIATIGIRHNDWIEAVRRLESGVQIPAYRSFALDAIYFATTGDPLRAIVMACAAWETALREYLLRAGDTKDEAYRLASQLHGIPALYGFVKIARGGRLFYDQPDVPNQAERELVEELPKLRNKLVHRGKKDFPEGSAEKHALAVLDAIDWLFRDSG